MRTIIRIIFAVFLLSMLPTTSVVAQPNTVETPAQRKARLKREAEERRRRQREAEARRRREAEEEARRRREEESMRVSATIESVTVLHHQVVNGEDGMTIKMKLHVKGLKDNNVEVAVYFYDENGNALKDNNGKYKTTDGYVSSGTTVKPSYDGTLWEEFKLSIPYSELHLSGNAGNREVKYKFNVWDHRTSPPKSILSTSKCSTTVNYNATNETITVNGVSFRMVRVEGGTFMMGATSEQGSDANSDEKPVHQVTLSSFSIGETEVTQELWQAVMGSNPSYFKGMKRPVVEVSWEDCQTFITKLNQLTGRSFRLPTEAEWEYAARGGNRSYGYKYAGSNNIGDVAWYDDNSGSQKTHDVGTKRANELGLYDMAGNVWEWCSDWYASYSSSSQTNPKGPSSGSGRVYRGGCWYSDAGFCRVSLRNYFAPAYRFNALGLRLAF